MTDQSDIDPNIRDNVDETEGDHSGADYDSHAEEQLRYVGVRARRDDRATDPAEQ